MSGLPAPTATRITLNRRVSVKGVLSAIGVGLLVFRYGTVMYHVWALACGTACERMSTTTCAFLPGARPQAPCAPDRPCRCVDEAMAGFKHRDGTRV